MTSREKRNIRTTSVQGIAYEVWSDYIQRATFAKNTITGEEKAIKSSGYLSNDLSERKAIAVHFGHDSFRK